jgi:hypothetical protein
MSAAALAIALVLMVQPVMSQDAPRNLKAFGCTIDGSDDRANIALMTDELTCVVVDKRQVPRMSLGIFKADKVDSMDWESHGGDFDAYLTMNWSSLGYRLDVYDKNNHKQHFQFSGQCKRDN